MVPHRRLITIEDYEPYIGAGAVDRISKKARLLRDCRVVHINSTYYGGGVAALLSSMSLLMNSIGMNVEWRVLQGAPDFFGVTKKMHNALQGGHMNLSRRKKKIYEDIVYENAVRNHIEDHEIVIVHDPHPLPLIQHYRKKNIWFWRCHIDLTSPQRAVWNYLKTFIEKYDAAILSLKEYQKKLKIPQFFFMPAIDPFTIKNRDMTAKEVRERLDHYKIPTDLPLIVQISRFDKWKDPEGVIQAFKKARKHVPSTLVLIGNAATDDPEGQKVYESLLKQKEERIIISSAGDDTALINALQRKATVVLQKSIREGFGLTVSEAMWKGTPVIGGNVGGIRYQIEDGKNGFLVSSIDQTADRIVRILKDKKLREQMGKVARQTVQSKFLTSRYLEDYLNLFHSFKIKI